MNAAEPLPQDDTRRRRLAEADRFLTIIDPEAESWCFQTFDDSGRRGELTRTLHGDLADLFDTLDDMNRRGAGVFATINEVARDAPRTAPNVARVRACFADFDPPKTKAPPERFALAPVLEIESSPGKRHVYWTIDGLALADFEDQHRGIIAALGSDPAVIDLPRVMRLPGFRHMKDPARPAWVRIVATDERLPYAPEDLVRAFPPVAKAAGASGERPDPGADPIAQALDSRGLVLRAKDGGGLFITCPWEDEHTTPSTPTSTVYYPPHTGGYAGAAFKCQHGHCQDRTAADLRRWLDHEPVSGDEWPDPEALPAPGDMGEASPFPLELLPPALSTAAAEVARFAKVAPAAPALVGLAALGVAIGKRALVVEREGLTHHAALFFVGIAGSGERKSPVFRAMTQALEDWTETQAPAWEEAKRKANARNTAVDAAISKAKSATKKNGDIHESAQAIADLEAERLPLPPYPRMFTSDATEQRLFQLMHDRGGAFAVLSGEGRPVFDAIMGKYSGDGRTGDALYLAGISGDTITRDRVGGEKGPEERVIRRPCLNVCIMVQPDKFLEAATHPALQASGAVGRIWPAWLPVMAGKQHEDEDEPGLSSELLNPYNALLRRLLEHAPPRTMTAGPDPIWPACHPRRHAPGASSTTQFKTRWRTAATWKTAGRLRRRPFLRPASSPCACTLLRPLRP